MSRKTLLDETLKAWPHFDDVSVHANPLKSRDLACCRSRLAFVSLSHTRKAPYGENIGSLALRLSSRLMVEADRSSRTAMLRIDSPSRWRSSTVTRSRNEN